MQRTQIEASVKSIGKCAQISGCIFAEVEYMMTPAQARFEVAENGIDPLELGELFRFSSGDHGSFMRTSCGSNRAEAGQTVRVNAGAGLSPTRLRPCWAHIKNRRTR